MFKLFTFLMSMFSQYNNIYSQEICVGDIDNNLSVDVNDLLGVLSNFGSEGDIIEDIDMNGIVDVNDLLGVLSNYGTECNVGYQCPQGLWWDNDTGNCVNPESCSEILILPPDIAIGRPFIKNNSNIHSLIVYEKNDWNEVF